MFGATGPTGQRIIARAVEEDYRIVAAARHRNTMRSDRPEVEAVSVDVVDPHADLDQLINGAVAVLSALGSRGRQPTTVYSDGTRRIVEAMGRHQVRRLICISSDGIETPKELPWPQRVVMSHVIQRLYRYQYADMSKMEAYLDDVPLDWTVIRAPRLTDGPPSGNIQVSLDEPILEAGALRRADLAEFMLDAIDRPDTFRRRVHLASPRKNR
ncbi:MAG: SDR family oxidoreductase [Actinomycetota bacterium]|nr:SDR family oxidoreductase [Actinomycetota bacterium]